MIKAYRGLSKHQHCCFNTYASSFQKQRVISTRKRLLSRSLEENENNYFQENLKKSLVKHWIQLRVQVFPCRPYWMSFQQRQFWNLVNGTSFWICPDTPPMTRSPPQNIISFQKQQNEWFASYTSCLIQTECKWNVLKWFLVSGAQEPVTGSYRAQ